MNSSGDNRSPCRVPTSVWNYSPWCLPIPTADWTFLHVFCSSVTIFSSMSYDFSTALYDFVMKKSYLYLIGNDRAYQIRRTTMYKCILLHSFTIDGPFLNCLN